MTCDEPFIIPSPGAGAAARATVGVVHRRRNQFQSVPLGNPFWERARRSKVRVTSWDATRRWCFGWRGAAPGEGRHLVSTCAVPGAVCRGLHSCIQVLK